MAFRPELGRARAAVQAHDIVTRYVVRQLLERQTQTVVRWCRRRSVTERARGEFAVAHHGMLCTRHRIGAVVKPRRQRLACTLAVLTTTHPERGACDERALEQTLGIEHEVIGVGLEPAPEAEIG